MRLIAGTLLMLTAVFSPTALFGQVASLSQAKKPAENEKTAQIVLYPMAAPRPALKYQLLPPFLERRPGNAAVWWNRLLAERNVFFDRCYKEWEESGTIAQWLDIPLGTPQEKAYRETDLAKVIDILRGGGIYSDMERAARFESCDWQLPVREGNFIAMLLPEIQQSRMYARLLSAKARLEIVEGKYAEAVRTLQTGYAEARHVAQGPTLINSLVGVTIAGLMSYQVQQFVQQPDAPNLYWALSTLPRPLVDFRPGGEAESNLLYLQLPELCDIDKKQLSPEGWRDLLNKVVVETGRCGSDNYNSQKITEAAARLSILQGYPRAKRYLIERGRNAAEVEAMPVAQVILLYSLQVYDELSEEQCKWFFLPAAEAGDGLQRTGWQVNEEIATREIIPLAHVFLSATEAAKNAETRCEWQIATLRIFEALRLYAAAHDGRLPERLSDITEVPIPMNPSDGKPFSYERQGNKAILFAEKYPRGDVPGRFEITLMPKAK